MSQKAPSGAFFMSKNIEKYGFVYIWRDKKHNRYYIGCHWGSVDDGYICSSNWMRVSYKNRPEDFKRRILKTGITVREKIYEEEQKFLDMIKPEEKKIRYYNLNLNNFKPWHTYVNRKLTIGQKISEAKKGKSNGPCSPETAKAISNAKLANGKGNGRVRKVSLFKGTETCKFYSTDVPTQIELGWSLTRPPEYVAAKKENHRKIVSEKLTGMKRPGPRSDAQMAQAREQQKRISENKDIQARKSAKISSLKWCYDPITKQNRRLDSVPIGWNLGKFTVNK